MFEFFIVEPVEELSEIGASGKCAVQSGIPGERLSDAASPLRDLEDCPVGIIVGDYRKIYRQAAFFTIGLDDCGEKIL